MGHLLSVRDGASGAPGIVRADPPEAPPPRRHVEDLRAELPPPSADEQGATARRRAVPGLARELAAWRSATGSTSPRPSTARATRSRLAIKASPAPTPDQPPTRGRGQ